MEETAPTPEKQTETNEVTETVASSVTEQKTELSLKERLLQATEKKPEPVNIKVDTSFFGSDEIETPATTAESEAKFKEDSKWRQEGATEKPVAITKEAKRSSARVAVGMLDMTMQSILTPIHGWKFNRKFKKEELSKITEFIDDSTLEALEDESDKNLKRKWDRLLKKYETKKSAIPLEEKEKIDLENAFFEYFTFKESTLPPEWFVGMAVVNAVGKRAIDLIQD